MNASTSTPPDLTSATIIAEDGRRLTLADLSGKNPLLLQFTRHLGCVFCADQAKMLVKNYEALKQRGIDVALVIMGGAEQAKQFRERLNLTYPVFGDPDQNCYRALGVPRGSYWQVAGPQLWWSGFKALTRNGVNLPQGDVMQLSGTFLLDRGGAVVWKHLPRSSAELPDFDDMLAAADAMSRAAQQHHSTDGSADQ